MKFGDIEKKFETKMKKIQEILEEFQKFSLGSIDRNRFDEEKFKMNFGKPTPYTNWWNCYLGFKDKLESLGYNITQSGPEVVDLLRRLCLSQGYNKVRKLFKLWNDNKYLLRLKKNIGRNAQKSQPKHGQNVVLKIITKKKLCII